MRKEKSSFIKHLCNLIQIIYVWEFILWKFISSTEWICSIDVMHSIRNADTFNHKQIYLCIFHNYIIQIFSGITRGRVLNRELYTHKEYRS